MATRKEFIVQTSTLCAGLALGLTLTSCKTSKAATTGYMAMVKDGKATIPLADIPMKKGFVVNYPNAKHPMFVYRKDENTPISVVEMWCTHLGNALEIEDNKLHCSWHGSEFAFDGSVLMSPAKKPLKRFENKIEGSNLVVTLA